MYESVMNSAPFGSIRSPLGICAQIASHRFALNVRRPSSLGFTRGFGHRPQMLIHEKKDVGKARNVLSASLLKSNISACASEADAKMTAAAIRNRLD
jgi:hypothetical protein